MIAIVMPLESLACTGLQRGGRYYTEVYRVLPGHALQDVWLEYVGIL